MIHVYCFQSSKEIIVTDRPLNQLVEKYGRRYELLTSFVSKDSSSIIIPRLAKNYNGFTITEWFVPEKRKNPRTPEHQAKIAAANRGKVRTAESKAKTSAKMKGRSNFAGKKHAAESKAKTSIAMEGNDNALGLLWCHHPATGQEKRVKSEADIPAGWMIGRDYYAVEPGMASWK